MAGQLRQRLRPIRDDGVVAERVLPAFLTGEDRGILLSERGAGDDDSGERDGAAHA